MVKKEIEEGKFWAVLSYFWILFILTLLLKKDNSFALYHAKQGLMLFILWAVIWILGWIPLLGFIIGVLGGIFLFILFLIGVYNALTEKTRPLPFIGRYGETLKL